MLLKAALAECRVQHGLQLLVRFMRLCALFLQPAGAGFAPVPLISLYKSTAAFSHPEEAVM